MWNKLNEEAEAMETLNVSKKEKYKTMATSFIMSALIVLGPIVLLVNTMIFYETMIYSIIGIGVFAYLLMFLTSYFYLEGITQKKVSIKYTLIEDAIMFLIVIIILLTFIIIGGRLCGLLQ